MARLVDLYNNIVKGGSEPTIIACHTNAVGSVIKDLCHEHIPVYQILIDDRYPGKVAFGFDDVVIPDEDKEHYTHFKITLPPSTDYWKSKGKI